MNTVGLAAALVAFFAIWLGHAAVRKIEFESSMLWLPGLLFGAGGILSEWLSFVTRSVPASTALGILGITLLWDALELVRQERRVRNGHAPANPANPRHAAFLAEPASRATTVNLLKREPAGR